MNENIDKIILNLEKKLENYSKDLIKKIEENIDKEIDLTSPKICVGLEEKEDNSVTIKSLEDVPRCIPVYIEEKYSKIMEIIEEDKEYKGYCIVKGNKYAFNYKLSFNYGPLNKEKEFQEFLSENKLTRYIYFNPYPRKMLNISIINFLDNPTFLREETYEIDLGDLGLKYNLKYQPGSNIEITEREKMNLSVIPIEKKKLFCIEKTEPKKHFYVKSREAKIDHVVKTADNTYKIYIDKEIQTWDICRIDENIDKFDLKGKFTTQGEVDRLRIIDKYKLLSKFELEKTVRDLCKDLGLEYEKHLLKKDDSLVEIKKYRREFLYPRNRENDFIRFEDNRKKIYLKFKNQDDYLFEDKVNYVLDYMNYIYSNINWNGVCDYE